VIAIVGLIGFISYELKVKNPAVNLKIMNNRNLAFTTIFTFVVGLGLFTSVFVYPVLAQRVLGYTAYETGLSLLPPTLIGVIMMPIIGRLMSKGAPTIPFVVLGFTLFAAYSWMSSRVSPDVDKWAFFFPLALRAFGISMVQLPLINQAVAGLKPKDYPAGIALNNMIRQLGGAFGIALSNNYIAHQYAQHRTDLVANIPEGSTLFNAQTHNIAQNFISKAGMDIGTATTKAYALIDSTIDRQAYYLSYLDTFRLITIFFIAVIPLVAFLKVKKQAPENKSAAAAAMAEAH
jgi:DHA2 family multidrug resistance protein